LGICQLYGTAGSPAKGKSMTDRNRMNQSTDIDLPREIAPGVHYREIGKGISRSNVYFVRSGSSWVLVDAASANYGMLIQRMAESLFGADRRPVSILLTHYHPDHAGSALELAHMWDCPVYMHPDELPLAVNRDLSTVKRYANPLDRWLILPLLRLMPRRRVESMLSRDSLKGVAQPFDPGAAVPGLPDWEFIQTPGHTPGHIAILRTTDRVLITGDAVVTANLNSLPGVVSWALRMNKQRVSGPPWYSTWNRQAAKKSVAVLAGLEPHVLASGHGVPMTGEETVRELHVLAYSFSRPATGKNADRGDLRPEREERNQR
jgi:glyoxylase-like metal-dependent hydrolase (beta-lactamase superfamily II)